MHTDAGSALQWVHAVPVLAAALLLTVYVMALAARRSTLPSWPRARTVLFALGCAMLSFAFWPPVASWAMDDFRGHMVQHLVVGMAAPLALALGAPVTLLLGAVSQRSGRRITALLKTRTVFALTRPVVAFSLAVVPMVALYFTPLYGWMTSGGWNHLVLHAHFLAAGYLFAWVIAGPDPAPHRAGVGIRIVLIGAAVTVHAVASQLMYAGIGVSVSAPPKQIQDGAIIMYFGGDLTEILLALALLRTCLPRHHRGADQPVTPAALPAVAS